MTMGHWQDLFHKFADMDAERLFKKYPAFWGPENPELYDNVTKIMPGYGTDVMALVAYYKAEAKSKDVKRIFGIVMRDTVDHHGYGPDQSQYLAVWYFIIVLLAEYAIQHSITDQTDLYGMFECYLNTGEIDYEHDWSLV